MSQRSIPKQSNQQNSQPFELTFKIPPQPKQQTEPQTERQIEPQTFQINLNCPPKSETGLEGSILDLALALGVDIDHACGGVCACSTCHIIVQEGSEFCNSSTDAEEDQLEKAPGLTTRSRLACQCVPNGQGRLVIEVPAWNRNLVRE
jgi:2Fe-2S ferredoxin